MVRLVLTLDGRLEGFLAATQGLDAALESAPGASREPDVETLFTLAGLDLEDFSAVQPRGAPSVFGDRRLAWEGTSTSARPRRIEATFWQGRLVTFDLTGPWSLPEGESSGLRSGLAPGVEPALLVLLSGAVSSSFLPPPSSPIGTCAPAAAIFVAQSRSPASSAVCASLAGSSACTTL